MQNLELKVKIAGDGADLKAELVGVEAVIDKLSAVDAKTSKQSADNSAKATSAAKELAKTYETLGVSSMAKLQAEIMRTKSAHQTLADSGTSSSRELAKAYSAMQSSVADIEKKTSSAIPFAERLKTSLGSIAAAAIATKAAMEALSASSLFGAAVSDLSAITGATGEQLKFLRDQSLAFGAATTLSASQSAEAFKLIASSKPDLLDNAQALAQVTFQTIKLSEASGTELASAADTVGSSLNQFSAGADQAARFVNVLAAGSKFGAASVSAVSESLKVTGTVAADTGLTFEQTTAAIELMANMAIRGSEAGTGLRAVLLKLSTQSNDQYNPAVVGLSAALQNLQNANLSAADKVKMFGQESITAANALINQAGSLDALTAKLTGTNTAMEQARVRNDNLAGDMARAKSATESLAISAGDILTPTLRTLVQGYSEVTTASAESAKAMAEAKDFTSGLAITVAKMADIAGNAANGIALPFKVVGLSIGTAAAQIEQAMQGNFAAAMQVGVAGANDVQRALLAASDPAITNRFERIARGIVVPSVKQPEASPVAPVVPAVAGGAASSTVADAAAEGMAKKHADKIVEIHAQQWQRIKALGAVAFGDEQARLEGELNARMAELNAEEQQTMRSVEFQRASSAEKTAVQNYYEQQRLDAASATADKIYELQTREAKKAMQAAKQVVDIHAAKWAEIQSIGANASASETDRLFAELDAKNAALNNEQQRMLKAATLQGATLAEQANLRAYYDDLRVQAATDVADRIYRIEKQAEDQRLADLEAARMKRLTAIETTEQQAFNLRSQFAQLWAGDQQLKLSSMMQNIESFAKQSAQWDQWTAMQKLSYIGAGLDAAAGLIAAGGKKSFDAMKSTRIESATIDGIASAVAAWNAGMATGGPWAPAVAASYTALSLAKTGAMIQAIKSQSFGGGGGASVSAGGGGSAALPAGGSAAPTVSGSAAPVPQSQQQQNVVHLYVNGATSLDQIANEFIPNALQNKMNNGDWVLFGQNSAQQRVISGAA